MFYWCYYFYFMQMSSLWLFLLMLRWKELLYLKAFINRTISQCCATTISNRNQQCVCMFNEVVAWNCFCGDQNDIVLCFSCFSTASLRFRQRRWKREVRPHRGGSRDPLQDRREIRRYPRHQAAWQRGEVLLHPPRQSCQPLHKRGAGGRVRVHHQDPWHQRQRAAVHQGPVHGQSPRNVRNW